MSTGRPAITDARGGSLRRKFLLVVMTATCAALLVSAAALLVYDIVDHRRSWTSDLASQADLIAQSVAPTLSFDDPKSAGEALQAMKLRPQIRVAAVYDEDGKLFASYRNEPESPLPEHPGRDGPRFAGEHLELFQPVIRNDQRLGTVYLRARHDMIGRIVDYLWIVGLASAAGLGLAMLIFRRLHPAITRPILGVAAASRRVMEERNYDVRVAETSDDEVGVLVTAFNNMLGELALEMKERQAAEDALRAADRRKDEFLATLAHELRNPLAPMANAVSILRLAEGDPARRRAATSILERQLTQMVRLIDDLLEVSRITRGKLELRRQVVDVVDIVRRALEAAEPMLDARHHEVSARLPGSALWVNGDAARLTQVFVNLLHNAAKYTPEGGRVELSVRSADGEVQVEVRDNGIGIDPADQSLIFEMFAQVDRSLERGSAGLGVGLTIARELMQMHGGSLAVRSEGVGRGTAFIVTLPAVEGPVHAPPATGATPGPAAHTGLRVLVADDNLDFANSFANLLRLHGHDVQVVHDGSAALKAAVDAPPDAAFLDIGMPGLNGYDLAARLRREVRTQRMLLVAVTGWGQAADRERVRAAGFDHHLVKPVAIERALQLLATLAPA